MSWPAALWIITAVLVLACVVFVLSDRALVSALWCRYCYGKTESGQPIAPNDPNWSRLSAEAQRARFTPDAWLQMRDIYGDLPDDQRFRKAFSQALQSIWRSGTRASIDTFLAPRRAS